MNFTYPHTIKNSSGEELTFVRRLRDENNIEYLEAENIVQPGSGPPMHVHFKQAESLTVTKGKIGIQEFGKEPQYFGEGETVEFKAGVPHRFWNAGTEPLTCKGWIKPAHNIEYFLSEIYKSMDENGGKRPGTFDSAFLLDRYKTEFDMLGIPGFVEKVIFPLSLFFGKLLGKHKKYANAPEPVK